jgi:hypothetical protein
LGRKPLLSGKNTMTVPDESASANSVPAAAVIQRMQALSGIIGRKASAGGFGSLLSKREAQLRIGGGNSKTRAR